MTTLQCISQWRNAPDGGATTRVGSQCWVCEAAAARLLSISSSGIRIWASLIRGILLLATGGNFGPRTLFVTTNIVTICV